MSRAVVYEAISTNADLVALGFSSENVEVNYDGDQVPKVTGSDSDIPGGMFIVIRWGEEDVQPVFNKGPINFEVWVHMLRQRSTDYDHVDRVINILADSLSDIINVAGADGQTVTLIDLGTKSGDYRDEAYDTLCRYVSFKMLSRATA
jgi:hypothetical protein